MTEVNGQSVKQDEARKAILSSIRAHLATSAPFDADWREHHGHASEGVAVWEPVRMAMTSAELADVFCANLESVGGHCTVVADETEAAKQVGKIIDQLAPRRIAISNSDLIGRLVERDAAVEIVENAHAEYLFDCDLGITSAQWAIAETGTLVLESDKESHRLTSLVPPVHLCLLRAADIRQTLGEILELTRRDLSRTVTFITGASRTSDIELTLAIGVHGPGELHVIVIVDGEGVVKNLDHFGISHRLKVISNKFSKLITYNLSLFPYFGAFFSTAKTVLRFSREL